MLGSLVIASEAYSHLLPGEGLEVDPAEFSSVGLLGTPAGQALPALAPAAAFHAAVQRAVSAALHRIFIACPPSSVHLLAILRGVTAALESPGEPQATAPPQPSAPATPVPTREEHGSATRAMLSASSTAVDPLSHPLPPAGAAPAASPTGSPHAGTAWTGGGGGRPPPALQDLALIALHNIGAFLHEDRALQPQVGVPLLTQVLGALQAAQAASGAVLVYSKPVLFKSRRAPGSSQSSDPSAPTAPASTFAKRTEEWLPKEWAEQRVTHRIKCRRETQPAPQRLFLPNPRHRGVRPSRASSAMDGLVREAHLVRPYPGEEGGRPDAQVPRMVRFAYSEAGPLVHLTEEDVAVAAGDAAVYGSISDLLSAL